MHIFISWSGKESKDIAEFLYKWLKKLPLAVTPWLTGPDVEPGSRWTKELSEILESTGFGILCITQKNQFAPWVNFEAGALAKTIEKTYVIPYLLDITPDDLEFPLKQFQAIEANRDNTFKMIQTIHKASNDTSRTIEDLRDPFDTYWPQLEEEIGKIKARYLKEEKKTEPSLPDLKEAIDNVLSILESLSSRVVKWEGLLESLAKRQPWESSALFSLKDIETLKWWNEKLHGKSEWKPSFRAGKKEREE
jgi:hypothetical protein